MYTEVDGKRVFASTGSASFKDGAEHLVLVHGAGMDHSVWVMPARHFARRGFNVKAPDLPGHGRSDGPPLATVEAMADWLLRFLDACGVRRTKVAGHSMGSLVAYALAARRPDRVSEVAAVGTSVPMPVGEQLLGAAKANDQAAIQMANTWSHSAHGRVGGNKVPGIWMLGAGQRLLERARPDVFWTDLQACNTFDATEYQVPAHIKALVVLGQTDMMTPLRAGRALHERLPGAQLVEFEGAGHSMLAERPNELLDALKGLFEEKVQELEA